MAGARQSIRISRVLAGSLLLAAFCVAGAAEPVAEVRLYAIDCGRVEVQDGGGFSDTFEYDGKPWTGVVPCFVIRHPKGTLLWDAGLGDWLAQKPDGQNENGARMTLTATLPDELGKIGLTPDDFTFIAFSHFHLDHTGNANAFSKATWILNRAEVAWGESKPGPFVNLESLSGYKTAKTEMIVGDHDVFGDGSVKILTTPGHTPGHQVLMLKLKSTGTVILSGDLYHRRESHTHRRIPQFNVNRADTLASMDRIETILKNTRGRLVVQHDPGDFAGLPAYPQYLQ